MSAARTFTTAEVLQRLAIAGVPVMFWWLPDRDWSTVSPEWVSANCEATLAAEPRALIAVRTIGGGKRVKTFRWIKGCNDCENIALKCMTFGSNGHSLSVLKGRRQPTGNLLGVPRIVIDENFGRQVNMKVGGGHAPNWFFNHDGEPRLHEPQGNIHIQGVTESLWRTANRGIAA